MQSKSFIAVLLAVMTVFVSASPIPVSSGAISDAHIAEADSVLPIVEREPEPEPEPICRYACY
ncbi:hypothetical protein BD779DRAFT_1676754 [Infundibulicybe gibba]|nr:hypothetical protein BD779DRAFT_1676754 [Infundibulicybe gibba]